MITVLSGTRAPTPESSFHLALTAGPRHPFPAILPAETPDRIPPPHVPAVHNGRDNEQHNEEQHREGNGS